MFTRVAGTPVTWNVAANELTTDADGDVVRTALTGAAGSISDGTITFDDEGQIVDENPAVAPCAPPSS